MLASLSSEFTFSQSLKPSNAKTTASATSMNLRRRFFDMQRDQERQKQLKENNQNQAFKNYKLHIPSSVRCPFELSPIESVMGDHVPFAAALHNVRSRCLPTKLNFDSDDFEWLDTDQLNNSSGESSSMKAAAKETAKRELDNFFFMYFRIRMENFVAVVTALKQSSKDQSIFTEENLDKWTHKYRFKTRRSAPLKLSLMAFSGRMGLDGDPDVMYCADGFYGDSFTGRIRNKNEIPNTRVMPANTSMATGLKNGSSIFVSRMTDQDRKNAFAQLQMDLLKDTEPEDEEADEGQAAPTPTEKSEEPAK